MSRKSSLTRALERWTKEGGDLNDLLPSRSSNPVRSQAEAKAICAALDALRAESDMASESIFLSPLFGLIVFFQNVESQEAFEVLKQDGLPRLRLWVRDLFDGQDTDEDAVMFILKILAMYRQREDVALIAEAARKPINADGFMWSIVLGQFDARHPFAPDMVDALRNPLPVGFILVAYLDMSNRLAIAGQLDQHPFNSQVGRKRLEEWLHDMSEENFSYARSATAALPFIDQPSRKLLLQAAANHPDVSVRMEVAWATAKTGDPGGLKRLSEFCLDPRYSRTARSYLEELGHADRIPDQALRPDFLAVAEMANWLAHPNEFGRPPDSIELYDTRELFWPPTNDKRQLWLVKYTYHNDAGDDPDCGVGMVGSTTFALFGEATADLSPEDIYSLHCCWELQMSEDSRSPEERSAKVGREILRRQNIGF